jgi:hypothetical protein
MATKTVLYITVISDSGLPPKSLAERVCKRYDQARSAANALSAYFEWLAGGNQPAVVHLALAGPDTGTAGTGTIACVQASALAGDRVTVANAHFTVATAPSSDPALGQFARGASNTDCAANLAAAINAHPALKKAWTATALTGTVTVTAASKGLHANLMNLETTKPAAFTLTQVSNGAEGTLYNELRAYRLGQ